MWSDSLFPIPEYINEFELKHYCFGEGDSSGGSTSDEDQMPDVQFAPDPTPAMDDANNPNSPSAGYVGGMMPAPMSVGYGRAMGEQGLAPLGTIGARNPNNPNSPNFGMPVENDPSFAQRLGSFLANAAFTAATGGLGPVGQFISNANTFSSAVGGPNVGSIVTGTEPQSITEQISDFFSTDPSFLNAENFGSRQTETDEARNEIASATDGIGFVGDDMPEGPSELIPVAPVSAMQRAPTVQQQQIAEALLQPQQGRAGYTRANVLGPIYNV
tara:strand:+ start:993 stop:1808 length:816 start_codon:yes stop_codon:yes gene_type:complete